MKGSAKLLETLKRELGGGTRPNHRDGMFSIEVVACIGACGLAPVISINGEFHARVTPEEIPVLLEGCRKSAQEVS